MTLIRPLVFAASLVFAGSLLAQNEKPDPPAVAQPVPPPSEVAAGQPRTGAPPAPAPAQPGMEKVELNVPAGSTIHVYPPGSTGKPSPAPVADQPTGPNIEAFRAAYDRAGEPRLLVIVGMDNRPSRFNVAAMKVDTAIVAARTGDSKGATQRLDDVTKDVQKNLPDATPTATGHVANDTFIGKDLGLFDATGDTVVLKSSMEEWLLANKDVELVNLEALAERDRRELALLELKDETAAIDLLGTKLNADQVIVVRLLNTGLVRERGAYWRVSVDMVQVGRGRKIAGFAFDWQGARDAGTIKVYAREIVRKLIEQYAAYYADTGKKSAEKYTLRLIGLADAADVGKAKKAFEKIPGMQKVTSQEFVADKSTSVATLTARYEGGPLDLLVDLQETAKRDLGMELKGTDSSTGAITLIATGGVKAASTKPRWPLFLDERSAEGKAVREQFLDAYRKQGSPKVAVVVTRQLNDEERLDPATAKLIREIKANKTAAVNAQGVAGQAVSVKDGVYVTLNVAGNTVNAGVNATPAGSGGTSDDSTQLTQAEIAARLINTRRMEDQMVKTLLKLGVTAVDPNILRDQVIKDLGASRSIYEEDELVFALGRAAGADIVLHGVARIDKPGRPETIGYTFRAVRIADGVVMSAESWPFDLSAAGRVQPWRAEDATLEKVAGFAVASTADQMLNFWTPAQITTVAVQNAKTQKDVFTVMAALKSGIADVESTDFLRHDGGNANVGYFTIRHRLTRDELLKRVQEQEQKLPITLDAAGTTKDVLTVKVK